VAAVEVLVVAAGLLAAGIIVQVLGRVPAVGTDVAAAAEGQGVIDDDHFLMMAGADRQLAIEDEADFRAAEFLAVGEGEEVLGGGHRHGRFPAEDAHFDVAALRQGDKEVADPIGFLAVQLGPGWKNVSGSNAQLSRWTQCLAWRMASIAASK
jgi:hypothetical protein